MSAQTPLTGGDGIPRERDSSITQNLFLLRPENLDYLHYRKHKIAITKDEQENGKYAFMFFFFTLFLGGFMLLIWRIGGIGSGVELFFVLALGMLLYTGSIWYDASQKRSRLGNTGLLFIGQITKATGKWKVENRTNFYYVTLEYLLRLPDGHTVDGTEKAIYMDMVGKPLPERGTPMAVLYLSDDDKMLL